MTLEQILTSGGDERTDLQANGFNKYHLNPVVFDGILTRGSCTGSPLNPDSYKVLEQFHKNYDCNRHDEYCEEVRNELKQLISKKDQDNFEVFLSPSGSDLCYLSLMFAKLLNPTKDITNYVTCSEELGSGSVLTLAGKIFSNKTQFNEPVEKGASVCKNISVNEKFYSARNQDGELENNRESIVEEMNQETGDNTVVGNLVIGSKSGIVDNITIIPRVDKADYWVVDICQLRTPTKLINKLLKQNCIIFITGSKFYQAPPFCGAALVPKNLIERFNQVPESVTEAFTKFFSKSDIPQSLPWLRERFREFNNQGMLYRWRAALSEMNKINALETKDVINTITTWNETVVAAMSENPEVFEVMPNADKTNHSIIPFRLKETDGSYFSEEKLKAFYDHIISKELDGFKYGYKRVALGQPVKYSGISFIRMAIGAYNIRMLLANKNDFDNDLNLVKILLEEARKFEFKAIEA